MHKRFLWGDMRKRDKLEDLGVDVRIILSGSRGGMEKHILDYSGSGEGQVAGACEYGNEISGSIKCGKIDYLRTC